jgi:hypothetical protein
VKEQQDRSLSGCQLTYYSVQDLGLFTKPDEEPTFLHFSDQGGTFLALNPSRSWKANQVNEPDLLPASRGAHPS